MMARRSPAPTAQVLSADGVRALLSNIAADIVLTALLGCLYMIPDYAATIIAAHGQGIAALCNCLSCILRRAAGGG